MDEALIVVADGDTQHRLSLSQFLSDQGYSTIGVKDGQEAFSVLASRNVDVLIADSKLPKTETDRIVSDAKENCSHAAVFVMTDDPCVNTAVQFMKHGAVDYLVKPFDFNMLANRLRIILNESHDGGKSSAPDGDQKRNAFSNIIGQSAPMNHVFDLISKIADADSTVILYGESGVGKELIAHAIHESSYRANRNFIPVNCGAIPEELLESELFGHEKGAFTGAHRARTGRFELADGGTIFLDEIGDMSPNLQVKILRVLQEQEFERVGGVRSMKVDIRVIAATHRDLEKSVAEGSFREDLYYRLNVIPINLPPLRSRPDDIPLLVDHFVERFNRTKGKNISGVTDEAIQSFMRYSWPGNVRELQNIIERSIILKGTGTITVDDLPEKVTGGAGREVPHLIHPTDEGHSFSTMVTRYEKQLIMKALQKSGGIKNKAAQMLKMNRTTLVEKMKKLNIN